MKNRAALVLMEQLVVVLVFALAAALCLLAFAHSHRISTETELRDRAVDLAVTGCETVKACRGDLEAAEKALGGQLREGILLVNRQDLQMEIRISDAGIPLLGQAEVRILRNHTGECVYSLTVSWQEVS